MVGCPACGHEVEHADAAARCPHCHLSTGLFQAVREAAGDGHAPDPAYLRTIAELLASVELDRPAGPAPPAAQGLLSRPGRFPSLPAVPPATTPSRDVPPIEPLSDLPALPAAGTVPVLKKRIEEYFGIGRRLGLDFTDFEARAGSAALVDDLPSLEVLSREMFVHLASAVVEEYESVLARRNELASLVGTPSVDVVLTAIRQSIAVGDLGGAQRRLVSARDELGRLEEEWEVGRILVTECDLLARTIRDLGGAPEPALGPLEEGRRALGQGRRDEGERLLARTAVALWAILEPRFFEELRKMRDRMVDLRAGGADVGPALAELQHIATELRTRNFVGTVTAYSRFKAALERVSPPEPTGPVDAGDTVRGTPSDL